MVLGTVSEAYAGVTRVQGCQRTDVSGTTRQGLSIAEDARGVFRRDAHAPKEVQYLRMRSNRQSNCLLRLSDREKELPYALPMPQSSRPVSRARPLSRSGVPARGAERFAGLFDMMGNQRSAFLELVGVRRFEDAC